MEKGNRGKLERVVGETGPIMARTRILVDRWGPPVCGAGYQRREIILFLTTTLSAMTSRVNQQFGNIRSLLGAPAQVDCCIMPIVNFIPMAFSESCSLLLLSQYWNFPWNSSVTNGIRLHMCCAKSRPRIFPSKGGFPLSCNFSVRTHVNFTRVNTIVSTYLLYIGRFYARDVKVVLGRL